MRRKQIVKKKCKILPHQNEIKKTENFELAWHARYSIKLQKVICSKLYSFVLDISYDFCQLRDRRANSHISVRLNLLFHSFVFINVSMRTTKTE